MDQFQVIMGLVMGGCVNGTRIVGEKGQNMNRLLRVNIKNDEIKYPEKKSVNERIEMTRPINTA